MSTNPYFKNFKSDRQQYLLESQTMEVIKRYGHDIKYIPREIEKKDDLFGEDVLSKFPDAATIEVYIKSVDGYEGNGRFMAKFGIEVRDKITFTMSRLRFTQVRTEKLIQETGYTLQNEAKQKYKPNETHAFILEDGNADGYTITFEKPRAGDLIYFPMVDKIFEITYVNHEAMFYQHGNLYTYDLECELFEYSSERFETEDSDIDSINRFSTDMLNNELLGEDGGLLQEDGDSFVNEADSIDRIVPAANNNVFSTETENLVDWSEINPLVDAGKSNKW